VRWGTVATDGSGLNIRAYPSTSSAILGSIPNGTSIMINGETDGWYVVDYNGVIGYSSKDYIVL